MNKSIGSRIGRREQLSQQERLIEQRRREIEDKLRQLEDKEVSNDCNKVSNESKDNSQEIIEPKSEPIEETDESIELKCEESLSPSSAATSVVNKFKNDGSFFAQFMQMQKNVETMTEIKVKSEPKEEINVTKDLKSGVKPVKLVIKESSSKLRAVSSIDSSNVKLCDDDEEDIKVSPPEDKDIESAIERTAISVTMNGITAEETMRLTKAEDNLYGWLKDKDSENYKYYRKRVEELSEAKAWAQNDNNPNKSEAEPSTSGGIKRQKKSRWGEEKVDIKPDPALVKYAIQVFGSTDLSVDQWKQLEDQRKMKMLFEMLKKKQKKNEMLANAGKVKYDYDSDEDITDGTWEHKRRRQEMDKTLTLAEQLTELGAGKHHIGDFMPPEELDKFMQKWDAVKTGMPTSANETDYSNSKLQSDNVGFQMLKKLGWVEGQGLGADGTGIADPVNKAVVSANNAGLGQTRPEELSEGDDEYEAYRKRMMLAYRFRPNPLNNPRRAYY